MYDQTLFFVCKLPDSDIRLQTKMGSQPGDCKWPLYIPQGFVWVLWFPILTLSPPKVEKRHDTVKICDVLWQVSKYQSGSRLPWRSAYCGELLCSNAYGGWFAPRAHHSVRMTYRLSAVLRLLGSLRISHNKFLWANKWIFILILKLTK